MSDSDRYIPTHVEPCTPEEAQARRDAHASRWSGIPAATLRGLRDGSLVAVPREPTRAWRHVKRGTTYVEIGRAKLQAATGPAGEGDTLVIYRGSDGNLWAREAHEFEDGRFEPVAAAQEPPR